MNIRIGLISLVLVASALAQSKPSPAAIVCEPCLRSEVEYLASDAMRGRGSGTEDELKAADHIAGEFKKLGLTPASGDNFIMPVTMERMKFTAKPQLKFAVDGKQVVFTHGAEMLANRLSAPKTVGKLFHAKAEAGAAEGVPPGSMVVIDLPESSAPKAEEVMRAFMATKASAVVLTAITPWMKYWDQFAQELPTMPAKIPGEAERKRPSLVVVKPESMTKLLKAPDGTEVTISGPVAPDPLHTRNVVGLLRGSDAKLKDQYVIFSAHMDHLGVIGTTGDTIYNGADDDASGTATVVELARIFSKGVRPKRSVLFVTFGSEELGLLGSKAFAANPPVPLESIVAGIEFEQTGLPQEKMDGHFWMTGSQLSDLLSELDNHGSVIGDDPFPGNPFFRASDNYSLAAKGVVAHTIGGAAEFPDYHKPGDEAKKLNYDFMAGALQKALPGFEWLVNTDDRPKYLPGKNPAPAH